MKRFLVFAGDNYYPEGGWGDFRGAYATKENALAAALAAAVDWAHVADIGTGEIVITLRDQKVVAPE